MRRSGFGFVFQFPGLLPELAAEENTALPLMLQGVGRRDAVARVRALLRGIGLAGLELRRPGTLSSGQAQRVGRPRFEHRTR
ncbi:hypothetical protein [Actinomadura chokoriensis]|uniref:hypothetical protein n=1 Tax=Actinomadura chokoriensis TaxID=454156 RepID=UPI0035683DEE